MERLLFPDQDRTVLARAGAAFPSISGRPARCTGPEETEKPNKQLIHFYDAQTTQITHGHWSGGIHALPRWSRDGRTAVWAIGDTLRYFELIENFQ